MRAEPGEICAYRCRICRGNLVAKFTRFNFRFARCDACGCLQKLLTPDEYAELDITYDPGNLFDDINKDDIRKLFEIEKKKRFLESKAGGGAHAVLRFLDIGCGQGEYLLAAKELGWDCAGIEPSPEHSEVGRRVFGLNIMTGYFESGRLGGAKFDVVLFSHVIEHLYDPGAFLDDVMKILAPAGRIIIVTPNTASFVARMTGKYWPMLKPPDHVTMMTPAAFKILAGNDLACEIRTSEFVWEPLATIIQCLRDFMKERILTRTDAATLGAPVRIRIQLKRKKLWLFLRILSVFSLPLHLAGAAMNREACLVVVARRLRVE